VALATKPLEDQREHAAQHLREFLQLQMREAVKRYFDENGFGADGGYADAWVDFKLGSTPFRCRTARRG
jgi:hypothetical protein